MSNVVSIILLVIGAGLFVGYINPTYRGATGSSVMAEKSVQELRLERVRYATALTKTREIEVARTGLLEKYNSIAEEDREKLQKLLPDHVDSVRLILDVNNIAAQYGMTLKNITLTDAGGEDSEDGELGPQEVRSEPVEFKFSVSGTYDNLRSFLTDLEQSLRLIDIRNLTFTSPGTAIYDYTVTIATYRLQ
ncbi:MAG: type 4a pilus biogenesis protein PilO [bacterium]|nr:type 4a pilus biogenesis protein PilO [bacterium]